MSDLFSLVKLALVCATISCLVFVVVLALPQSKMRDVAKNVMLGIACAIYCLSPIDIMPEIILGPFGLVDDLGALIVGITAAKKAIQAAA